MARNEHDLEINESKDAEIDLHETKSQEKSLQRQCSETSDGKPRDVSVNIHEDRPTEEPDSPLCTSKTKLLWFQVTSEGKYHGEGEVKGQRQNEVKDQGQTEVRGQRQSEIKNQGYTEVRGRRQNEFKDQGQTEVKGQGQNKVKTQGEPEVKSQKQNEFEDLDPSEVNGQGQPEVTRTVKEQKQNSNCCSPLMGVFIVGMVVITTLNVAILVAQVRRFLF